MKTLVISAYPMSGEIKTRIVREFGDETDFKAIVDLRQLQSAKLWKFLRGERRSLVLVPFEDENSASIVPLLKLIGCMVNSDALATRNGKGNLTYHRRWECMPLFFELLWTSLVNAAVAARDMIILRWLYLRKPLAMTVGKSKAIAYLKTNLWFGVKAGGSVGHIAGVVNEFHRRGYRVNYFSAESPVMAEQAIHFERLNPPGVFGVPAELNNYRFNRQVIDEVLAKRRSDYSFIYQRLSISNYAGVVISRRLGVPLILEYNGSEVWVAKHWGRPLKFERLAKLAEKVCLRHASLIVTVSEPLAEELSSRGVDPAKIIVYPNCIDETIFNPQRFPAEARMRKRHELGLRPDDFVITFIGTFGAWHGAEVLAEAIRRLAHGLQDWLDQHKVRFLFVGDGLRLPAVRRIVNGSASDYCVFTGLVPQVEAPLYLALSDTFVSPHVQNVDKSKFFGSPTKLFEYMSMAKPIIASDMDQIGEILRGGIQADDLPVRGPSDSDGMAAVLTTPGDVHELIEGVRFVVERPDWRVRLGINARNLALSRYTWRHHVDAIIQQLTVVLPNP